MGRWVGRDGVHTCHGKGFDERYGVKKVAGMSRLSPDASC